MVFSLCLSALVANYNNGALLRRFGAGSQATAIWRFLCRITHACSYRRATTLGNLSINYCNVLALGHALLAPLCHLVRVVKFITSRVAVRACPSASTVDFSPDKCLRCFLCCLQSTLETHQLRLDALGERSLYVTGGFRRMMRL